MHMIYRFIHTETGQTSAVSPTVTFDSMEDHENDVTGCGNDVTFRQWML